MRANLVFEAELAIGTVHTEYCNRVTRRPMMSIALQLMLTFVQFEALRLLLRTQVLGANQMGTGIRGLIILEEKVVEEVACNDIPMVGRNDVRHSAQGDDKGAYLTSPSSASLAFVSFVSGVDASTHTCPFESLMAVERPPTARRLNKLKGLFRWCVFMLC